MPLVDDQQTYLLNGLLNRHFGLGRIVRFREVQRGRQAQCLELFTAQEQEYLVQLYPPAYSAEALEYAAAAVNLLDANRFSVVPHVHSKQVAFAAPGPQNHHLLVSLAPVGSALTASQFTLHDITQVGLRLAWMHRLLKEVLPQPPSPPSLVQRFAELFSTQSPPPPGTPPIPEALLRQLQGLLGLVSLHGWAHGDAQLPALLHDNDHQLRAITDWGLLHYGCPLEDLVDAFLALAYDPHGNLDRVRGRALLESYDTLFSIKRFAWTPVIATWCAQRLLDHHAQLRPLPNDFPALLAAPESLAMSMASCT